MHGEVFLEINTCVKRKFGSPSYVFFAVIARIFSAFNERPSTFISIQNFLLRGDVVPSSVCSGNTMYIQEQSRRAIVIAAARSHSDI